MRKKARYSSPQSSFLGTVDTVERPTKAEPEIEIKQAYVEFPKIVIGSLYCPDCGSKAVLRPDGLVICPKCISRIPCGIAEVKK